MKRLAIALAAAAALAIPGSALTHVGASPASACTATGAAFAQAQASATNHNPTWWAKYQYLLAHPAGGQSSASARTGSPATSAGPNVDVSNECGPQSETFITLNPSSPQMLAAGSNEIFRLPMRGYASSDDGSTWGGVDLPLPPPTGANGTDFGSDPTLAFDTNGRTFYGYIVVFFGNGNGIKGTEMAVARSTDGGRTYPAVTYFSPQTGTNHFNDKPMIASDTNLASPYRDNVYAAWDAASGGSTGGGVRFARSTDHGASFTVTRIDDPGGPGRAIGADPFVGPNGEVYAAWNDYTANAIVFNRSLDGGATWDAPTVIATKNAPFDVDIPAESVRRALVYPACDADRSAGVHRGRLYCSWMDTRADGTTNIYLSYSDNRGSNWSQPMPVGDAVSGNDRFNQWLSVDPVTGQVNVSFYDTRNDTTGSRYETDTYLSRSTDGVTWQSDTKVTTARSNEHDCAGVNPCSAINYGNQQGDYEGLVAYGGVAHPIWTDSRLNQTASAGCRTGLAMEEVFTARVQ
jgi:hypothetical protein